MKKIILLLLLIILIGEIYAQNIEPLSEKYSVTEQVNWDDTIIEINDPSSTESYLNIKNASKPDGIFLIEDIKVYPNPTSGVININGIPKEYDTEILLFNIVGKQIKKVQTTFPVTKIDIGNEPDGIYFLKVDNFTKKIVKR